MTMRVPTPEHIVAQIKSIVNLDRRERQAAGYKYGSRGLVKRISEQLGLNWWTVKYIKERRRHKHVRQDNIQRYPMTLSRKELEVTRQRRIKNGFMPPTWKPGNPTMRIPPLSYRERLFTPTGPGQPPNPRSGPDVGRGKSPRPRRLSRSPKQS